jgi:DNA-binding NtrC family response regulator
MAVGCFDGSVMEKDGMYIFLLVSPRMEELDDFTVVLSTQPDITLRQVASGEKMMPAIEEERPHLVILDQEIKDKDPLALVTELLTVNAMINTAMITDMDAETWHEKSEGLGMLPSIENPPTRKDALVLLENFRGMPGLS